MALEALADPARAKGAVRRFADELGVHPEALRIWVRQARDRTRAPGLAPPPMRRPGSRSRRWRSESCVGPMRSCARRVRYLRPGRSVSAGRGHRLLHRRQPAGARGLADLHHAQRGRCADRPECLTHARRSRPPSARSLCNEVLKAEISRVHKNQLLGAGSPQDARDAGPP